MSPLSIRPSDLSKPHDPGEAVGMADHTFEKLSEQNRVGCQTIPEACFNSIRCQQKNGVGLFREMLPQLPAQTFRQGYNLPVKTFRCDIQSEASRSSLSNVPFPRVFHHNPIHFFRGNTGQIQKEYTELKVSQKQTGKPDGPVQSHEK